MGLLSIIGSVVGTAIGGPVGGAIGGSLGKAGEGIIGGNKQKKSIDRATEIYRQGAQQGAAELNKGYREGAGYELGALEQIGDINLDQLATNTQLIQDSTGQYATDTGGVRDAYGRDLRTLSADYMRANEGIGTDYGASLTGSANTAAGEWGAAAVDYNTALGDVADRFGTDLSGAAGDFDTNLQASTAYAEGKLDPYMKGSGTAALNNLSSLLTTDPSKLSPSQLRLREQYIRSATARQASSGLRGAGRAGVAATNEGLAELESQFYDSNQARSTDAANRLAEIGYGATQMMTGIGTGNIEKGATAKYNAGTAAAEGRRSAGNAGAGAIYDQGIAGATARKNASDAGAATMLNLRSDSAKYARDADKTVADTNMSLDRDVIARGQTGDQQTRDAYNAYYTGQRGVAAGQGQVLSGAAQGQAQANAGAVTDPAYMSAMGEISKGKITADVWGNIIGGGADILKGLSAKDAAAA